MTTRQRMEWPTVPRRKRKRGKRKLSPNARRTLAILFAIASLACMVIGLLTESLLWYLVMALSAGATLAQRRALQMQAEQAQERRAGRPTGPPRARPTTGAAPPTAEPQQTPSGSVLCTETGKPIDQCGCASRHVATAEGSKRYGLPVGSPMGKRSKTKKPSATTKTETGN